MPNLGRLNAVILVGGLGTRLRKSITDRPKAVALVNGQPFLNYLLDDLVRAGIKRVVLCTGYMGDYIENSFGSTYSELSLAYSKEEHLLGTAGALKLAESYLVGEEILVMNGDSYVEYSVQKFLAWHKNRNAKLSILLSKVTDVSRYGCVEVDSVGQITSFSEKSQCFGEGLISAGVYILSREVIDNIPSNVPYSLEINVFPSWIAHELYGYQGGNRFIDIGTPDSYAAADDFLNSIVVARNNCS